ncbi:MAG TPA: hypothetical protein VFN57_04585 [Thermomicrobiaceae bacterium]|nr:hypothetical protein [Thermomicrobiaceae bacterium]
MRDRARSSPFLVTFGVTLWVALALMVAGLFAHMPRLWATGVFVDGLGSVLFGAAYLMPDQPRPTGPTLGRGLALALVLGGLGFIAAATLTVAYLG